MTPFLSFELLKNIDLNDLLFFELFKNIDLNDLLLNIFINHPITDISKNLDFQTLRTEYITLYRQSESTEFTLPIQKSFFDKYNKICINYCQMNQIPIYLTTTSGGKKKSLSNCTISELRSKMKKKKLPCSKDGKKLTKSQMIQKLRR